MISLLAAVAAALVVSISKPNPPLSLSKGEEGEVVDAATLSTAPLTVSTLEAVIVVYEDVLSTEMELVTEAASLSSTWD